MQLFDADNYVREQLELQDNAALIKPLEKPDNKVPSVNLPKLAFDKKIVPIVLDVRFGTKFML
jgi:hypothetical protein